MKHLTGYKTKHFKLYELVPPDIYKKYGETAWRFLDARILYTADCLREYFDLPLVANTWMSGGDKKYRGYRPPSCSIGAPNSAHRRGQAIDLVCPKRDIQNMRLEIIEKNLIFPYLTVIEDKVNWLHISCENIVEDSMTSIKIIQP